MTRLFLTLVTLISLCAGSQVLAGQRTWVTQAEVDAAFNGDTCKHYVNRAKFKHRHPDQEFVVTLADSCLSAKAGLESGNPGQMIAAKAFLLRLRVLRDTIIEMNMERAFGKSYKPRTRMSYGVGSMIEPVRRVSSIGEYMIAREMGLIAAYRAWVETGPKLAKKNVGTR